MKKIILILSLILISHRVAEAQWVLVDTTHNWIQAFADNGSIIYAAVSGDGIYRSTNYGQNWTLSGHNLCYIGNIFFDICAKDSLVYLAAYSHIYKSTNYGTTWDSIITTTGAQCITIFNNYIFAGAISVSRSSDWGNTWETVNNGLPSSYSHPLSFTQTNNILFVGIEDALNSIQQIYKSTNFGNNWISTSPNLAGYPYYLYADSNLILCGANYGVYISTNFGTDWRFISDVHNYLEQFGFASSTAKNIFVSTWGNGIYVSNDYGQTWTQRNEGLANLYGTTLHKFGSYLFLGTDPVYIPMEMYRRPYNELVGIRQISTNIPDKYKLFQNYPNPFNPNTKIDFAIQKNGFVILKIFDILGREIYKLVNEYKRAGFYTASFNGSQFASGVYFYRIQAGKFSQVKRMMLIK